MVVWPAGGGGGVYEHLPDVSARQGRPPATGRPAAPLPIPTRRGGCISLDFLELPVARSGQDFLQVYIDLLTWRVWLVPTFKTAAAEEAARNFVGSVFRDVRLPDVLVSDRDTRFTRVFWTGMRAVLGA